MTLYNILQEIKKIDSKKHFSRIICPIFGYVLIDDLILEDGIIKVVKPSHVNKSTIKTISLSSDGRVSPCGNIILTPPSNPSWRDYLHYIIKRYVIDSIKPDDIILIWTTSKWKKAIYTGRNVDDEGFVTGVYTYDNISSERFFLPYKGNEDLVNQSVFVVKEIEDRMAKYFYDNVYMKNEIC